MKDLRNLSFGLISFLFVLQLAFVSPVSAQSSKQVERERLNRVMDSSANVEDFRQELTGYFTEMEDSIRLFNEITVVREKLNRNGLEPLKMVSEAKLYLANATPEDLRVMRDTYARFPGWRDVPQNINALIKPELRGQLEARLASKQSGDLETNAVTPDNCQDGINADISNTDIAAAKTVLIAAQATAAAIPPVLNIPAVAAVATADAIVLTLETLKAIKDDCTSLDATAVGDIVNNAKTEIINNDNGNASTIVNNDNTNKNAILSSLTANTTTINNAITNAKTDIVNNDNTNKTTIINNATANTTTITTAVSNAQTSINNTSNSNATALNTAITNSTNTIVTNDNANKTAIINNDNANTTTLNTAITNAKTDIVNNANANATALMDALLRSQIEADLATESNAVKVGWYLTPTSKGGKLDLVQSIVTLTLANIQAAGGNIGTAQSFLNQANADKAAGNFKSAYDNYRRAYKAAVN